jgi:hypothetical protein
VVELRIENARLRTELEGLKKGKTAKKAPEEEEEEDNAVTTPSQPANPTPSASVAMEDGEHERRSDVRISAADAHSQQWSVLSLFALLQNLATIGSSNPAFSDLSFTTFPPQPVPSHSTTSCQAQTRSAPFRRRCSTTGQRAFSSTPLQNFSSPVS